MTPICDDTFLFHPLNPMKMAPNRRRFALIQLWVACGLLGLVGCASSTLPAPNPNADSPPVYRVEAPDELFISVLPDPRIERNTMVRPDGKITMDLVGDVNASGRTAEEIAAEIEGRIKKFKREASVTVSVIRASSRAVTMLGELNGNGSFALLRTMRVAEAIAQSGGYNRFANADSVRLIRTMGDETHVYNVDMLAIEGGDLRTNILLRGGDIVYAPPTIWARFGHALNALLYPLQPLLGVATSVAGSSITNAVGL
ncbi:polysaccharide export protein [Myxococcota bacterium]|nr:polysaccharide export protein [Myxococcota bacterium]